MTAKVHQNYINGQWLDGYDVIDNVNPSDFSDIVGQYAKANASAPKQWPPLMQHLAAGLKVPGAA